ncbi:MULTISPECIES: hypothetical protein [Glutamicibacter]|uniref:hypothetical protein n=1 Tax=Glutamicibacter TaxID=1742989 RepID=UPI003FD26FEB
MPASKPTSDLKSANEAIEEFRRANDASAREKVTVTLDPAVLGALRDLKKLHKLPQGVAIDIAVKNFYPDLYEKNVQELKDLR